MNRTVQPLLAGLELKHTIASKRNQQWVEQCSRCGTLVCVSSGANLTKSEPLGPCPACGGTNWLLQYVPATGLGMFRINKEAP